MYKVIEQEGLAESCTVDVPAELCLRFFVISQNHEVLREKPNTLQDLKSSFLVAVVAAESVGNMQSKMILQILRRPLTCNKKPCQENKSDSWLVRKCRW